MAPDKIYIPLYPNHSLDGVHLGDDWMYEPHKECDNVEYIHKDALLEWLDGKMTIEGATEGFVGGYDSALKDVIEHINKM